MNSLERTGFFLFMSNKYIKAVDEGKYMQRSFRRSPWDGQASKNLGFGLFVVFVIGRTGKYWIINWRQNIPCIDFWRYFLHLTDSRIKDYVFVNELVKQK